jgi:hypothetical protein
MFKEEHCLEYVSGRFCRIRRLRIELGMLKAAESDQKHKL